MTLSLRSRLRSPAEPQILRAFDAIRPWAISATDTAFNTLIAVPTMTFTRALASAFLWVVVRVLRSSTTLSADSACRDRDRVGTRVLRRLGDPGRSAVTCPSAEAAGD